MAKVRPKGRTAPRVVESRVAEACTVWWMLSVLTALACEIAGGAAALLGRESGGVQLFAAYALWAALMVGGVALLLTIAVYKLRQAPPPRAITALALCAGAAPWVVLAVAWFK